MNLKTLKSNNGITLIELLVGLGIFAIFIAVTIGTFVQSLSNQRIALKLMAANDNASLALEQIAREVRTGNNFSGGQNTLNFTNANKSQVSYTLCNSAICKDGKPITAGEDAGVGVESFSASPQCPSGPNGPCRVKMEITVSAKDKGKSVATNEIKTTVSSRVFGSEFKIN